MRLPFFAIAALLVAFAAAPARAGGIVLESYTGDRPIDAPRLVNKVLGELVSRGYNFGDTLARVYETKVSHAAITPAGIPPDFAAQVDAGFRAWVSGRFDQATQTLGALVEDAHANAGAIARDQSLREPLLKALIGLALAQQRTGDPDAAHGTFVEILHAFPDTVLSRATYGAEAFEAFEAVRREVAAAGTGKLSIHVDDDTAVVFVDEQYRAVGSTTLDLAPGEYRVCVLLDKQPSRTHRVVVRANGTVQLAIDPRFDQAVRTAPWTGLEFATDADRDAHEGPYAAAFANAIGATAVAVVGIDEVRGRPAVVGSLVSLETGREIRRASVALDPDPSTDHLRALARYLAGEEPASGIDVQQPLDAPAAAKAVASVRQHAPESGGQRWGGWKWLTGGVGVAGLGTGVVLAVLDGRCKGNEMPGRVCNDVYATAPGDYIALAGGAALVGISVYLFATAGTHEHGAARAAYVVPARGGALAGFATSW